MTAHLYAEWIFKGVSAVAQTCCQLVWHSSTEEQGRQFTLNSSALVFGDCTHVCRVDLHRCKCSGAKLLSAGLAQQHRRTRQAVYPKHCSSALVFGDCRPVCRVDLHRCKYGGTRLLSAGLAQQHRRTRQALYPKHCSSAVCLMTALLYAEWIFIAVNAVAQGCCQLVWHSSTEEQGRHFTLNTAAVPCV